MKIDTLCVQGGYQPKCGEPRQVPIYQTTTFKYDTTQHMGDLFDLATYEELKRSGEGYATKRK